MVLQFNRNLSSAAQAVVFLPEVMGNDLADQVSASCRCCVMCGWGMWYVVVVCPVLLLITSGVSGISAIQLLRLLANVSLFIKKRNKKYLKKIGLSKPSTFKEQTCFHLKCWETFYFPKVKKFLSKNKFFLLKVRKILWRSDRKRLAAYDLEDALYACIVHEMFSLEKVLLYWWWSCGVYNWLHRVMHLSPVPERKLSLYQLMKGNRCLLLESTAV